MKITDKILKQYNRQRTKRLEFPICDGTASVVIKELQELAEEYNVSLDNMWIDDDGNIIIEQEKTDEELEKEIETIKDKEKIERTNRFEKDRKLYERLKKRFEK